VLQDSDSATTGEGTSFTRAESSMRELWADEGLSWPNPGR